MCGGDIVAAAAAAAAGQFRAFNLWPLGVSSAAADLLLLFLRGRSVDRLGWAS